MNYVYVVYVEDNFVKLVWEIYSKEEDAQKRVQEEKLAAENEENFDRRVFYEEYILRNCFIPKTPE